jgi:putative ABC transport system permease protein
MTDLQTLGSALLTIGLVAVAVVLSLYERLDLEKDIGIAVVRSFLQLAAIGFVINYIFGLKNIGAVVLLLGGMVLFAAWTSARRARDGSVSIAAILVGTLSYRSFFTPRHQLRTTPSEH